jgi:cell division protein FtsZ
MVRPGLINLDFADVRAVMDEMGKAMMGTGEASGDERAVQAAEKAIANPLLDEISLNGAKGVLINITGGHDLTLFEVDEAANIIREKVDPEANIIVGSTLDTSMEGRLRVSVVATGIDASAARAEVPVARRSMAAPLTPVQQAETPRAVPQPAPVSVADPMPALDEDLESGLFDAAASQIGIEAEEPEADDELPPPAYRPQAPAPQPSLVRSAPAAIEADAGDFVAPRPRSPGQPSPEALARLQAAVSRPATAGAPARFQRPTPVAATAPAAAAAPLAGAGKPRFGIGSLINRMAGHLEATGGPIPAPAGRAQPPVTAFDDDHEIDNDQDRIEIPAFLRRQAN